MAKEEPCEHLAYVTKLRQWDAQGKVALIGNDTTEVSRSHMGKGARREWLEGCYVEI